MKPRNSTELAILCATGLIALAIVILPFSPLTFSPKPILFLADALASIHRVNSDDRFCGGRPGGLILRVRAAWFIRRSPSCGLSEGPCRGS